MQKKTRIQRGTGLIAATLKLLLYALLFLTFFAVMGIDNRQMLNLSRTSLITAMTFSVLIILLMGVYGGYAIGKQKSKPIIYSMTFATVITDLAAWLQLLIMNVNEANRPYFMIQGIDMALLAGCILIQFALIIIFTYLGNALYFHINPPERCCVITASDGEGRRAVEKIGRFRLQYEVVRTIDYRSGAVHKAIENSDSVFLCALPPEVKAELIEYCYKRGRNIYFLTDISDIVIKNSEQVVLDDLSFLTSARRELTLEQRFVKRSMDIALSTVFLILSLPLMLICAAAIWIEDRNPVFFRQNRYTRGGRVFCIYKFRTMRCDRQPAAHFSEVENDDRITRVGRILRRMRVDELPQLINILKGEMSLVGPRPEMLENSSQYVEELPEFAYRLSVKAGLTGYAQIVGKYNTTPRDKMVLDLMYIANYSAWLDIKLLLRTPTVLFRPDSNEAFQAEILNQAERPRNGRTQTLGKG